MDKYGANNNFNTVTSPDEIIFAKKAQSAQLELCSKTVSCEISDDIIIPDYLPELRRLLRVSVRLPEPSRYLGGDVAELSGNVSWCVVYVGSNGELKSTDHSSPYELSTELDADTVSFPELFFEMKAENVTAKVTSPRKISLRCRLSAVMRAYGYTDVESRISGDVSEESIKKLEHSFPVCRVVSANDSSLELEDSFPVASGTYIAALSACGTVDSVSESNGETVCRGSVTLKLAVCEDNGAPSFIERKLPFTASPELELEGDGYAFRAYAKVSDVNTEVIDENAVCRVSLCVICEAQKNVPTLLCTDVFSTEKQCEAQMKSYDFPISLCCDNFTVSHEGSGVIDGLFDGAGIGDVYCTAEAKKITVENGRYILHGICKYNIIFVGDGEYAARETEFPFTSVLCEGGTEVHEFFADLEVCSCRIRAEGENLAFSADISAAVRAYALYTVNGVSEADFLEARESSASAYKIAYPASNETLWDIAKRYASDPKVLADANGIKASVPDAADSLSGVKYLIIQ